jgi:hypothetical protein
MLHVDINCLTLLNNETQQKMRKYLFVGIADVLREFYAALTPIKRNLAQYRFDQMMC